MAQQPTYRAYTVIKRGENQDDFWLAIGAAFRGRRAHWLLAKDQ